MIWYQESCSYKKKHKGFIYTLYTHLDQGCCAKQAILFTHSAPHLEHLPVSGQLQVVLKAQWFMYDRIIILICQHFQLDFRIIITIYILSIHIYKDIHPHHCNVFNFCCLYIAFDFDHTLKLKDPGSWQAPMELKLNGKKSYFMWRKQAEEQSGGLYQSCICTDDVPTKISGAGPLLASQHWLSTKHFGWIHWANIWIRIGNLFAETLNGAPFSQYIVVFQEIGHHFVSRIIWYSLILFVHIVYFFVLEMQLNSDTKSILKLICKY